MRSIGPLNPASLAAEAYAAAKRDPDRAAMLLDRAKQALAPAAPRSADPLVLAALAARALGRDDDEKLFAELAKKHPAVRPVSAAALR